MIRPFRLVRFLGFYLVSLIRANLRLALDVMTPGLKVRPGFLAIPLRTRSDAELLIFSNLVTMTPGTLTVDVSPDRRFLFIHAMYLEDPESVRREVGEVLQGKVLEVLR